jgi:hypothetical protein
MSKPSPKKSTPKKAEPSAVVEGTPHRTPPADPVAMVQREVVGLVTAAHMYRPAPADTCPADIPQATWNHTNVRAADGSNQYDEAYAAIKLSILAGVRVGTTIVLRNEGHGTKSVAGIGGVHKVDELSGGLLVGIPVAPGGEPSPITGEDRVNVITLTRALTLWCVTPDGEQRAVTFTPENMYAVGVQTLAPVNGSPRSLPLWVAPLNLFAAEDVLSELAKVEASLTTKAATGLVAEVGEATEVLTV